MSGGPQSSGPQDSGPHSKVPPNAGPADPACDSATPPPLQPQEKLDETADALQVYQYLMYGLSLPERTLRGTTALVGGALSESAGLLLPQAFRSSKSYDVFVQQMLDFMVRDMGGVEAEDEAPAPGTEAYIARKTVGGLMDMMTLATLHVSPVMVLAIVSDVAYGSQAYLSELSQELKAAGVIDEETTIDHASDLLVALGNASKQTAEAFDTPPLSLAGLQETIAQTQEVAAGINPTVLIPQAEMESIWKEMHTLAEQEGVSLFDVSSAMSLYAIDRVGSVGQGALSTVRVAGNMFDRHIFDHYRKGLSEIQENGFYETFSQLSRPYIAAVWMNFAGDRPTITEDLLTGKMLGRAWKNVNSWWGK